MKWKMLFLFAALTVSAFAENENSFVRKIRDGETINQLIRTADGNYVSLSSYQEITRLNNKLEKEISKTIYSFSFLSTGYASLSSMDQVPDGFVLAGNVQPEGYYGSYNGVVVKVDSNGVVKWNKAYIFSGNSVLDLVVSTSDGGFIAVGGTSYEQQWHPFLLKCSSDGTVFQTRVFDSLSYSYVAKPSGDHGIILAAYSLNSEGSVEGLNVIKINETGTLDWSRSFRVNDFYLNSIVALNGKGYLLAGILKDLNTLGFIRLNSDGTFHSKKAYSLPVSAIELFSVVQTVDGGAVAGGALINKAGGRYDGFLLKLNDRQSLVLQKRVGFKDQLEEISQVIANENGGYVLFGSSRPRKPVSGGVRNVLIASLNRDGTVPGCGFSRNLKVSRTLFGKLASHDLSISITSILNPSVATYTITTAQQKSSIVEGCEP